MKTPEKQEEPKPVRVAIEGTVVDWAHGVQVNPVTGERYDFDGNLLEVKKGK